MCVCPLAGLSRVSHEHLAVALALEVPVACVITKADIAPPEAVQQVLGDIRCCTHSHAVIQFLCHLISCGSFYYLYCVRSCLVVCKFTTHRHNSCLSSCGIMWFDLASSALVNCLQGSIAHLCTSPGACTAIVEYSMRQGCSIVTGSGRQALISQGHQAGVSGAMRGICACAGE